MGHDIYGFKPSDKENEIAYLRRSAFDENRGKIYEALHCKNCYGGVSGTGDEHLFTAAQLNKALTKLTGKDLMPERAFLYDCLKHMEDDTIIILFS